jgi:hypothetical protein
MYSDWKVSIGELKMTPGPIVKNLKQITILISKAKYLTRVKYSREKMSLI